MKTRVTHNIFSLRVFLALLIVITEVVYLDNLVDAPFEVVLSSAAVTLALLLELAYAVRGDVPTAADGAVFIFNWLFLDLAPKIQLIGTPAQLVNTSSVTADRVALTNLMCALFIIAFTCVYAMLSSRVAQSKSLQPADVQPQREYTATGVGITLFICVAVVALAAPAAYHSVDSQETVSPGLLIMNRFLLFLPSASLLILLNETLRSPQKLMFTRVCAVILLLVLVMITENTYTEKRNALGPLYLSLLLIGFQGWFKNRTRRLLLLVVSLVLGFPALEVATHNHSQALGGDFSVSELGERIEEYYFSINYDAWSNLYASTEIVAKHGIQWGHQLLGSLLFFVPSALWTDKPQATGIFIAEYLINHYSMWFTNLSAPLVAEAYLDFGSIGVMLYGGVLAWLVASLNKFAMRRNRWWNLPLAVYASMFLVFMLRGSLMVAMGFATAAFLSFASASALLSIRLESDHERLLQQARKLGRPHTNTSRLSRGV